MVKPIHLQAPISTEEIEKLRSGDRVSISGYIYTGRDAAHKRLCELIDQGKDLPIPIEGQIIYYVGPSPPKPGKAVGSAGPTTSYRMDPFTPKLLQLGLKAMIGKGKRSEDVKKALTKYKAVYMAATGGAGALISRSIKEASIVAYEDLGPEAVRKLKVENLPAIVVNDAHGNDLYLDGQNKYKTTGP